MSWSTDEVFSIYKGDSTTLQWNIISDPLNYSYHFEEGDTDFERHGYGGIWGGTHLSAHHNLFANCNSRNPRLNGVRLGATTELVDLRNNVIYNWGHNNVYGGEGGTYNIVNNYYKYGPETQKNVRSRIVNPGKDEKAHIPFGRFFVSGNFVDEAPDVTLDNRKGVHMGNKATGLDKENSLVPEPFKVISIPQQTASSAFEAVLRQVGAILPKRDTMDERIIANVRNRTGNFIDVQGGYPHGTAYEKTINAWPALAQTKPAIDRDEDGMPDEWERKNGLDPQNPNDAILFSLSRNYSNIEIYINSLVK